MDGERNPLTACTVRRPFPTAMAARRPYKGEKSPSAGKLPPSSANDLAPPTTLRVLTVNTHKGFAFLNRRFVLHELRDAVRAVGADLVFLQEVHGRTPATQPRWPTGPRRRTTNFSPTQIWPQFAYGRNAVYPHGHHGNAVLSKFPIVAHENHDVSVDGHEKRGLLHCMLRLPGRELDAARDLRAPRPERVASPPAARRCSAEMIRDARARRRRR